MQYQCFYGQAVRVEPETADHASASGRNHGVMAKLLALMHVGDVHLNDGDVERTNAVVQCHTGVGICAGIEHDALRAIDVGLLQAVDEKSLYVALIVGYLVIGIVLTQLLQTGFHGVGTIDARFALTQEIKVGSVDN